MKITLKLILLFSAIVIVSLVLTGYLAFKAVESAVLDSEIKKMQSEVQIKSDDVTNLNAKWEEEILFAAKNPIFKEYFSLPDTQAGNSFDKMGMMTFSPAQYQLKKEMDNWVYNFQNSFGSDMAGVFDRTGQDHSMTLFQKIVPNDQLMNDDNRPYFTSSFATNEGQVNLQYPYVSSASSRWVYTYSTPIVLDNGEKIASLFFEIPLFTFQNIIVPDSGRMYVVDPHGYLIADSKYPFNHDIGSRKLTDLPTAYFPSIDTISTSIDLKNAIANKATLDIDKLGEVKYEKNGETYYVVYKKLRTFDWILAYEKPYSQMLAGASGLDQLKTTISLLVITSSIIGVVIIFVASSRITKPIKQLAELCKKQDERNLKKIDISTKDEINDVTKSINGLIERVNEVNKEKEEFSSMITHELKTPLTPIIGWCQALKSPKIMGSLDGKQTDAVDKILSNARKLQQLIGDILNAERLELGQMKFDKKHFEIKEFMEYIHLNMSDSMKQKNIEYVNSTKETIPFFADKNRLEQVMNNLIINAIDFVPNKGRIEIGAKRNGNDVLFYVIDNGEGILPEKIPNLFQKFYQVDTSATRKHGGTGLGLAMCKGIVEGHGGKIWVESDGRTGSRFYFTIPKDERAEFEDNPEQKVTRRNL
jgi:signal transduction histidine kinase